MSGVLRPVGPQPVQTYWARRALVLGAAAMVLVIAVALIISGASNGSTAQPNPSAGAHSVGSPTTSMRPAKSQANRKPKSLDAVMVPERARDIPGGRENSPIEVLPRRPDPL
jgi:hypothetical protein